ncbi:MAG: YwqG family protein [Planctomycetota bacterium]
MRFSTKRVDDDDIPVGATQFGGNPDLPVGVEWPSLSAELGGKPLSFIAQLDLAEIAAVAPSLPVPKTGHLSFFYDADGWLGNASADDTSTWRVLHLPQGANLRRIKDEVERENGLHPCLVEISPSWSIPSVWSIVPPDLELPDEEKDNYFALAAELSAPAGQLLGYANEIQGPIEEDAASMSGDIRRTGKQGLKSVREAQAKRWRLLFQLDSDDELDVMWGDAGMIYYAIRREDLAAAKFDETMLTFQCS